MDVVQGRIIILDDNYVGEDEVYLVTVYTGHRLGSGTTANVCIELNGTVGNSRVSANTKNIKQIRFGNDERNLNRAQHVSFTGRILLFIYCTQLLTFSDNLHLFTLILRQLGTLITTLINIVFSPVGVPIFLIYDR